MRETRNVICIFLVFVFFGWSFWAWFMSSESDWQWTHRALSLLFFVLTGILLFWSFKFEDKLPDTLAKYTGGIYYEQAGLCFMPVMRQEGDRAKLCIYYENRYENPCNAVVHLRPPPETIQHRPDAYDLHFAFSCPGGAVGIIQQPVAVHPDQQGQVVNVQLAAAVNYPHTQGEQLRSHRGLPCGTFRVDWGENFRTGMHELSGEIELIDPVTIHLAIPTGVSNRIKRGQQWKQQVLETV